MLLVCVFLDFFVASAHDFANEFNCFFFILRYNFNHMWLSTWIRTTILTTQWNKELISMREILVIRRILLISINSLRTTRERLSLPTTLLSQEVGNFI